MYVCIKLHITVQPGPAIYSSYATACNPPGGYLSSIYSWLEMRVHTAPTPLPTRRLSAGTPLPRHQLQCSALRKIWGRKRGKWWTGLSPSNTWVKLVARRLAQQIKTGIRYTGSTTANSTCNLPLQTQQSRPPHQTVQRTAVVVSSFHPLSLSTPTRCVSRLHPHIFSFYARKSPPAIGSGVEHQP